MPIIVTMPMTLIKNPDKIGSIDFNFIEACKCMQKKQYVKAYKFFKICEDQFRNYIKKNKNCKFLRAKHEKFNEAQNMRTLDKNSENNYNSSSESQERNEFIQRTTSEIRTNSSLAEEYEFEDTSDSGGIVIGEGYDIAKRKQKSKEDNVDDAIHECYGMKTNSKDDSIVSKNERMTERINKINMNRLDTGIKDKSEISIINENQSTR